LAKQGGKKLVINCKNKTTEDKRYRMMWAIVHLENIRKPCNIGVCGYNWEPCYIGTDLDVLTTHDFFLNTKTGNCEEALHCFNLKCKFNRATPESITTHNNWSDTEQKHLKKNWKNYKDGMTNYQQFADECKKAYNQDSMVSVIEIGGGWN